MLRSLWGDFVGLIFPRLCLACREPLVTGENHLCTGCRAELPYTDFHLLPFEQNPIGRRFWGKLPVRHTLSYLRFVRHGRVQNLLHELKYQGQRDVGTALGQLYGAELRTAGLAADFDLVVPVPLHPRKQAKRGYNQAAAFAHGLARALSCPAMPLPCAAPPTPAPRRRRTALSAGKTWPLCLRSRTPRRYSACASSWSTMY